MAVKERSIAPILRSIGKSVNDGKIGNLELEHGYDHHKSVAQDALYIYKNDQLQGKVDIELLLTSACVHDFIQRGNLNPTDLENILSQKGLKDTFIKNVLRTVNNHELEKIPDTPEEEILWLADKINYLDPDRFRDVHKMVNSITDPKKREQLLSYLNRNFKDKWIKGVQLLPKSPLMQKYPSAQKLLAKRKEETIEFMENDGNNIFSDLLEEYRKTQNTSE